MSIELNKTTAAVIGLSLAYLLTPVCTASEFAKAMSAGETHLQLRYRLEAVDQDGLDSNAAASTLRLRLNHKTGQFGNWHGFVEFDHVAEILSDNFNSGAGTSSTRRNQYPVVADPNGSDLNQVFLQHNYGKNWQTRIGRQRILLDDQRYVGGVGWRQNEQTYDGLSTRYKYQNGTQIFYSYVANVNRIFGSSVAAGDHQQSTHLLNVSYPVSDSVKLVGYGYSIDNEDAPAFSTQTLGLRLSGSRPWGNSKFMFHAEYASQSDAANSPLDYTADYIRAEIGANVNKLTATVGYELLGSDNGQGYRTPLATLHKFNGWADRFLATPGNGLEDVYVKFGYTYSGWNMAAAFHQFSSDVGGVDFGSEFDAVASRKFGKNYTLLLKLASFKADTESQSDVTKAWVMLRASFR